METPIVFLEYKITRLTFLRYTLSFVLLNMLSFNDLNENCTNRHTLFSTMFFILRKKGISFDVYCNCIFISMYLVSHLSLFYEILGAHDRNAIIQAYVTVIRILLCSTATIRFRVT